MSTSLVKHELASAVERVVVAGDLGQLKPEERLSYYKAVCDSVGLNPLTRPLEYITLNGKLTLYARRDCTDQLRNIHSVSVIIAAREVVDDCYVVTSRATKPDGRTDESIGAVPIGSLKGEAKCNAMMKAETKSKRRVTLSICGLGLLDETEIESIPSARPVDVQRSTEPRVFGKPNGSANSGSGDEGKGSLPQATSDTVVIDAKDAPPFTGMHVTEAPVQAAIDAATDKTEYITAGQSANFYRTFKDSLKPALRKDSDKLAHDFLRKEGIKDALGEPSALAIRKDSYYDVRDKAVDYAKHLIESI
jgi:hypothetical protein